LASSADDVAVLRSVAMFSALDAEAAEALLRAWPTVRRPAGAQVFAPGEPAERFYVVLAGRVKVFQLSPRGDEQILHLYGPGAAFAEAAVLAGGSYPAFAEAVEDSMLLVVGRAALRDAIRANPELAMGILAGLSAKLHEFNRLIEELSLKEVPARLAGVLLRLAGEAGGRTVRLKQSKRQLAAQIGTVAETLSRALGKLKAAGLIRVRGAEITILDPEGLEELAGSGESPGR
jgi:CRP-like cAMP-binding protein